VPSFTSWWNGSLREAFTLEQLLATAELAMQRRGVTLTEAQRTLYAALHEETARERRRVLRESEQRAFAAQRLNRGFYLPRMPFRKAAASTNAAARPR